MGLDGVLHLAQGQDRVKSKARKAEGGKKYILYEKESYGGKRKRPYLNMSAPASITGEVLSRANPKEGGHEKIKRSRGKKRGGEKAELRKKERGSGRERSGVIGLPLMAVVGERVNLQEAKPRGFQRPKSGEDAQDRNPRRGLPMWRLAITRPF